MSRYRGQCAGITRSGEQCKGIVQQGSDWCPAHNPARAEARRRAASKAGSARSDSEAAELKQKLATLYEDVRSGRCKTSIGQTCATVAGVQLKALDTVIREREVRVKELEFSQIRLPEFQQLSAEVEELRRVVEEKSVVRRNPWAG